MTKLQALALAIGATLRSGRNQNPMGLEIYGKALEDAVANELGWLTKTPPASEDIHDPAY